MTIYENIMDHVVDVFKALADPNRLRALIALHHQELCVCQIVELLGLSPSTVSKHMSILKQAGLVETDKRGRWVYYRLSGNLAPTSLRKAIEWGIAALDDEGILLGLHRDKQIGMDRAKLKNILKIEPEELCCRQWDR